MLRYPIPSFCLPCIERLQAQCPHLHTSTWGGWHYDGQDVWDDITDVCDDCGADLDALAFKDDTTQSYSNLPKEETPCKEN